MNDNVEIKVNGHLTNWDLLDTVSLFKDMTDELNSSDLTECNIDINRQIVADFINALLAKANGEITALKAQLADANETLMTMQSKGEYEAGRLMADKALANRVRELEAQLEETKNLNFDLTVDSMAAHDKVIELEAKIAELKQALKPFAEFGKNFKNYSVSRRLIMHIYDNYPDVGSDFLVGDFRNAAKAMEDVK